MVKGIAPSGGVKNHFKTVVAPDIQIILIEFSDQVLHCRFIHNRTKIQRLRIMKHLNFRLRFRNFPIGKEKIPDRIRVFPDRRSQRSVQSNVRIKIRTLENLAGKICTFRLFFRFDRRKGYIFGSRLRRSGKFSAFHQGVIILPDLLRCKNPVQNPDFIDQRLTVPCFKSAKAEFHRLYGKRAEFLRSDQCSVDIKRALPCRGIPCNSQLIPPVPAVRNLFFDHVCGMITILGKVKMFLMRRFLDIE